MQPASQRAIRAVADKARADILGDLQRAMADAGLKASDVARAAGIDEGFLSRILNGTAMPSVDTWARIAVPLGLDLSMRLYSNTGPAIRDRHSAPMLEALLAAAHPRWAPYTELLVHRPSRGAIDVGLHDAAQHLLVAGELQGELRRLEQLVRWQRMKAESLPSWEGWVPLGEPRVSRLLVVRRTRATRRVVAEFGRQLRVAYPAHPDDALDALTRTAQWPGPAMLWMAVERGRARFVAGR